MSLNVTKVWADIKIVAEGFVAVVARGAAKDEEIAELRAALRRVDPDKEAAIAAADADDGHKNKIDDAAIRANLVLNPPAEHEEQLHDGGGLIGEYTRA